MILFAMHRKAIIWRITSFVISIVEDEDYDVLTAEGINQISNNIVYIAISTTAAFSLCSICGCTGAAFQKKALVNVVSSTKLLSARLC